MAKIQVFSIIPMACEFQVVAAIGIQETDISKRQTLKDLCFSSQTKDMLQFLKAKQFCFYHIYMKGILINNFV